MIRNIFTEPTLRDLMQNVKDDVSSSINCINIGKIISFNSAIQTAVVQIQIKRIDSIKTDGTVLYKQVPLLFDCPVVVMFGGGASLTFPISAGDSCLVLFNDREIDNWFATGQQSVVNTQRTHSISDGIALVGINSLQSAIQNYLTAGIRLAFNPNTKIELTSGQIASLATLWAHTGNMKITGNLELDGTMSSAGGTTTATNPISATQLHAGNGATGTFNIVTVVDGIVTSGTP